jgi:hypothetical protein
LVWQLAHHNPGDPVIAVTPGLRLGLLQAWRWRKIEDPIPPLREALGDESPDVRLYAVRWVADERILALHDDVAKLLDGPLPTPQYYLAVLGAVDWLDHDPELRNSGINDALLVRELKNENRSPTVHALALRMLSPDDKYLTLDRLREYAAKQGAPVVAICAKIEAELAEMDDEDKKMFLAEIGQDEPGLNRLIRAAYDLLGLQTFFTAGPKEVRAWTIHIGDTGPQAAGVIHDDSATGEIRAERYALDVFVALPSEQGAKDAGKMRAEGKEYIVKDGDVMNFLFSS